MPRILPIACAFAALASLGACGPQPDTARNAVVAAGKSATPVNDFQSPDAQLRSKVKQTLDTRGVEVSAADGVVTLYGKVNTAAEPHRLAMLAMSIEGVRSVVNNLEVTRGS
jgi:osmotically-inducible protein OsmY